MNLVKTNLLASLAIGILSGSALAAPIDCTVTPAYSIITEGQTLQLAANCSGGALASVDWKMDGVSVTGPVTLSGHAAGDPVFFTTPVGLGGSNAFLFTVEGVPFSGSDTFNSSSTASVVVKPSSAVVAKASGSTTPTTPVPAACGSAYGSALTAMPTGTAQCSSGKAALAVTGPQSFTWSCLSLTGGAEASCYAVRGYTVTASVGGDPAGGSVTPPSQAVNHGSSGTFTVTTSPGYTALVSEGTIVGTTWTIPNVTSTHTADAEDLCLDAEAFVANGVPIA